MGDLDKPCSSVRTRKGADALSKHSNKNTEPDDLEAEVQAYVDSVEWKWKWNGEKINTGTDKGGDQERLSSTVHTELHKT